MNPAFRKSIFVGYFPVKTWRKRDQPVGICIPDPIEETCNLRCNSPEPGPDVREIWLHNEFFHFDDERHAWAAGTQTAHLLALRSSLSGRWDGVSGSIEQLLDRHIAQHIPLERTPESDRDIYACFVSAQGFQQAKPCPFPFSRLTPQPLPPDYEPLGFDVVSVEHDQFSHSPLSPFCNGKCGTIRVNRHCLLDDLDEACRCASEWSVGRYSEDGGYIGNAEPGPYFVVRVFRKTWGRVRTSGGELT